MAVNIPNLHDIAVFMYHVATDGGFRNRVQAQELTPGLVTFYEQIFYLLQLMEEAVIFQGVVIPGHRIYRLVGIFLYRIVYGQDPDFIIDQA